MLKKALMWGGAAFVIFMVAFQPSLAARAVRTLGDTVLMFVLMFMVEVGDFFTRLVS